MDQSHTLSMIVLIAPSLFAVVFFGLVSAALVFSEDVVLFSDVHGQVTKNGVALPGAEVFQDLTWEWTAGSRVHRSSKTRMAITDSMGQFHFPIFKSRPGVSAIWIHQPRIQQSLTTFLGKEQIAIWKSTKTNYTDRGELHGQAMDLACELGETPTEHGTHFGVARVLESPK